MSEPVHVHAPDEFSESHDIAAKRREHRLELVATLLLAIATLGIAWSGYQGARWNGKQTEEYSASNAARAHANRALTAGAHDRTQDLLNFNRWLEVETEGNQRLADLYQRRFRPELQPAFEAWMAEDPLNNPNVTNDTLTVTSANCTFNFGSIALGGDYVTANTTFRRQTGGQTGSLISWNASTNTLVITLGTPQTATTNTGVAAAVPVYTPPSAIKDTAGNPINPAPFNGTSSRF